MFENASQWIIQFYQKACDHIALHIILSRSFKAFYYWTTVTAL